MEKRIGLSPRIYTQPRSQTIYGSLVETFRPYPQYYMRIILNFYREIVTSEIIVANKTRIFFSIE